VKKARGNKKDASRFYNCVQKPLFLIETHEVSPPYLHILLGIVWKHHVLLRQEASKIDEMLQKQETQYCTAAGLKLKQYEKNWAEFKRRDK
jgi:hypothetical protein